jgi:hypothetical protein
MEETARCTLCATEIAISANSETVSDLSLQMAS